MQGWDRHPGAFSGPGCLTTHLPGHTAQPHHCSSGHPNQLITQILQRTAPLPTIPLPSRCSSRPSSVQRPTCNIQFQKHWPIDALHPKFCTSCCSLPKPGPLRRRRSKVKMAVSHASEEAKLAAAQREATRVQDMYREQQLLAKNELIVKREIAAQLARDAKMEQERQRQLSLDDFYRR